jgi:5-dehydro-2-deoxygluconokinase
MTDFDVLTMGRVGVDVYPLQVGVGLEDVESFGKYLGGSATNVAVAAARYGRRSAVITRVGDDPFGRFVHKALRGYGVDDRFVTAVPGLPTPVTFCEIFPPDRFPLYFYRQPTAPDLQIRPDELDLQAIRSAAVFWVTATGLCQQPSRSATLAALAARDGRQPPSPATAGGRNSATAEDRNSVTAGDRDTVTVEDRNSVTVEDRDTVTVEDRNSVTVEDRDTVTAGGRDTVLDLDYRPMFWQSRAEATKWVRQALEHVTVAVGNLDECEVAVGTRDPHRAAQALRARGVRLAVVKRGPDGVLALDEHGTVAVPPVPVAVVNGLGAGDAFGGALCHGLLAGWDTERIVRFANAAGAIVASRLACSEAMPTADEVTAKLGEVAGV